jgi:hypothetical protein
MPLPVGVALLASADGYTPRANAALDHAREELGSITEIANALADNLPAPKLTARKSRRRRRKRKGQAPTGAQGPGGATNGAQAKGAVAQLDQPSADGGSDDGPARAPGAAEAAEDAA